MGREKTMKKKIIGMFISMLLMTSGFVIMNAEEKSSIKEKNESLVFSEPTIQEGDHYLTLTVAEATSSLMKPGNPMVPLQTTLFRFPFGTKIKAVECIPSEIHEKVITGEIQPAPEPVLLMDGNMDEERMVAEKFTPEGPSAYTSMEFFPSQWYDFRTGCGLDSSQRMVLLTVQFYPVRYSPAQQMIQYATKVDIHIEYDEPIQPVVFADRYDMVIITPSQFVEQLRPLVAYKNDSSVITKLVTLNNIYAGTYFPVNGRDDQEKIKYFIKDAVEQWNITNVLLAGGSNNMPVRMSYVYDGKEESLISDLYYADIYDANGDFCSWDSNGNNIFGENNYQGQTDAVDLYPDVRLGRLCFNDVNEVSGVVDKIITYESTGAYMAEWFSNFVVCGGDTFPDYDIIDEGEYLNQNAIDMMNGFLPEKIWATNGKLQFAGNIDNALRNGTGFLYMTGHGTFESWATHPHNDFETWWPVLLYLYVRVDLLNNAEKLPVVIIGGCSNCQFLEDHNFGWSFVKNKNGGGIACYGNTALGWGYVGTGCAMGLTGGMELSAFKAYGVQNAKTTGELWAKAVANYLDQFGVWSTLDYKTVEEWQSFSDPSLRIRKESDPPNAPSKPYGNTSGYHGKEYSYTTSATDPDGDSMKYCFDWDDNTVSWTEPIASGASASFNHTWEKPGVYEVRVKARDTYGLDSAWSETLVVTIVSEAAFLNIESIKGGFAKIRTVIKNIGVLPASEVKCNVTVTGGMLGLIHFFTEETLGALGVDEGKTMVARGILGIGKINVTVTASAPSANIVTKTVNGFMVGPLIIVRS
jgi:hypothetical protein